MDIDLARSGPKTLAGRYIRQFWQPVYLSADLPVGYAKPFKILNQDFTIYRGESGKPYVVGFRCAHRGTQLSTGWVEGDGLRCFYHGWKYDGSGQCIERPAEVAPPDHVRIPGYPTEEYLGLIFVYFGEGAPPPLPRYPRMELAGVRDVTVDTLPVNYFYSLENDTLHFAFTHRDLMPEKNLTGIPEVWAEESDWGMTTFAKWPNSNKVGQSQKGMPNVRYIVPSAIVLAKSNMNHALHMSWRVPRDDASHYTFRINLVTMSAEEAREFIAQRPANYDDRSMVKHHGDAVLAGELRIQDIQDRTHIEFIQDYVAQVGQGSIENRRYEQLGRSDTIVALLRKLWRREMTLLAEGKPLKQWKLSDKIEPVAGL